MNSSGLNERMGDQCRCLLLSVRGSEVVSMLRNRARPVGDQCCCQECPVSSSGLNEREGGQCRCLVLSVGGSEVVSLLRNRA